MPMKNILYILLSCSVFSACSFNTEQDWNRSSITIIDQCQKVAKSYPFNADSKTELRIKAFEDYFSDLDTLEKLWKDTKGIAEEELDQHLEMVSRVNKVFYKNDGTPHNISIRTNKAPPNFRIINDTNTVDLQSETLNGIRHSKVFNGDWGFFRFLDTAHIKEINQKKLIIEMPILSSNNETDVSFIEYEMEGLELWPSLREGFSCPKKV